MMLPFAFTVPCSRPATTATTDELGHTVGETRTAVTFDAVFCPEGGPIIDMALREMTVTKPILFIDRTEANAAALAAGAIRSRDAIVVNSQEGWQVDGDPQDYTHPWTGWKPPLVVELRRTDG
ncbi:MAG: hypothetical protein M0R06_08965 [Sphaerochaeta sp.]|nr:hypothetical protein [Sphaerochaeta sp.]